MNVFKSNHDICSRFWKIGSQELGVTPSYKIWIEFKGQERPWKPKFVIYVTCKTHENFSLFFYKKGWNKMDEFWPEPKAFKRLNDNFNQHGHAIYIHISKSWNFIHFLLKIFLKKMWFWSKGSNGHIIYQNSWNFMYILLEIYRCVIRYQPFINFVESLWK